MLRTALSASMVALAAAGGGLPYPVPTQPPSAFASLNALLAPVKLTPSDISLSINNGTLKLSQIECGNVSLGDLSLPAAALTGGGAEMALVMQRLSLDCKAVIDEAIKPLPAAHGDKLSFGLSLNTTIRAALQPPVNHSVPTFINMSECAVQLPVMEAACTPKLSPLCIFINTALPGLAKAILNTTVCDLVAKEIKPTSKVGSMLSLVGMILEELSKQQPDPWVQPAKAEAYLAPYKSDIAEWSKHGELARLANLIDIVPTWLIDWIIGLIAKHGMYTLHLNKTLPVALPSNAGKLMVTIESVTLGGLNKFTTLKPLKLESGLTWRSQISTKELSAAASVKVALEGGSMVQGLPAGGALDLQVSIPIKDLAIDASVIVAVNETRFCELGGASLKGSLPCMLHTLVFAKDKFGNNVSGLEVSNLEVSLGDLDVSVDGLGVGVDNVVKGAIAEVMLAYKPAIVAGLPRGLSSLIRTEVNTMLAKEVGKVQSEDSCPAFVASRTVNVSRVCVVNNAFFDVKYALHDCRAGAVSASSGAYPIDQHRCMDLSSVSNMSAGDVVRVATDAVLGKRMVAEPALVYTKDSNVATFVCSGTTESYDCKLMSLTPTAPGAKAEVSRVCVSNDAGFVLEWRAQDTVTGNTTSGSGKYPIDQTRCLDLDTIPGVAEGHVVDTSVHAVWGKTKNTERAVVYRKNGLSATFVCKGTTLDYSCKLFGSD